MKLRIISDIHANLPALRAVLSETAAYDLTVCCGDLVGYYNYPNEVCNLCRTQNFYTIRGNHDSIVCGELTEQRPHPAYKAEWTRATLTSRNLDWLKSLPVRLDLALNGHLYTFRHASLEDEVTYLYPNADQTHAVRLQQRQWLICGHTHIPLLLQLQQGTILNPGSVGQPRDYDPRASWAVLDTEDQCVSFCRTSYDVQGYQRELREANWPFETIEILSRRRGKSSSAE
jgi:putative phosphoesterase